MQYPRIKNIIMKNDENEDLKSSDVIYKVVKRERERMLMIQRYRRWEIRNEIKGGT